MHAAGAEVLRTGELEVRPAEFLALAGNRRLGLTRRELELLVALMRRPNRIVTREELYLAVWRAPFRASERAVDVYVRKLRVKLERSLPGRRFIHTHVGFGYRFAVEPSQLFHTRATAR